MAMVPERAWCTECGAMKNVEDRFLEDTGDSRVTVEESVVTVFSCGHDTQVVRRTYPSPLQQQGPTQSMTDRREP